MIVRGEGFGLVVHLFRCHGMRIQEHPVAEGCGLTFVDGVVESGLGGIEDLAAQGIRGKQTVAASMPVSWISRVAGVIHDRNGDDLVVFGAGQGAPAPARSPCLIAALSFAGQIDSARTRRTRIIYFGGRSVGICKDATFFCRRFKPARNADAEQPFFVVVEDDVIEGLQSRDLVDDARVSSAW